MHRSKPLSLPLGAFVAALLAFASAGCSNDSAGDESMSVGTDGRAHDPVPIAEDAESDRDRGDAGDVRVLDTAAAGTRVGLCAAVDMEAVEALMGESLEVEADTDLSCRLRGAGPNAFRAERNKTGGAAHYDRQIDLLGSDEVLSAVGDRAFRSGHMYGVQAADQYLAVVFATAQRLDATERLRIVRNIVAALP